MTDNDLLKKINTDYAAKVFTGLYQESGVEAARSRYIKLILEILKDGFSETNSNNKKGSLRIFSAPGRTELAGNHTDHNNGKVLAASIQMDSVAIVQERNDDIVFFRSSGFSDVKVKLTDSFGNYDLNPKPEEAGKTEALVRGIAAEFNKRGYKVNGFTANASSTVLPGSGLSSSAALEVLIGRIFDSLYGKGKNGKQGMSPLEIAQIGQIAENEYFKKPCGLMDQTACATGGAVAIDFADVLNPAVKQIDFDLTAVGYTVCVVNTGGSHADLTPDYAAIPSEMKAAAAFFGKETLRELEKETVLKRAAEVRKALGDRALLRSLHYFDENVRVDAMTAALMEMQKAVINDKKNEALGKYLNLVNESGNSSWKYLQNIYSVQNPQNQGISIALSLTKDFLRNNKLSGACRVHGGGFAGTIQAYFPIEVIETYRTCMEAVFGTGSVTPLRIRSIGAVELVF